MPDDKPALLWHSNAPHTGTGYGTQTALWAERLAADYRLAISAFYGVEGAPISFKGIPVLPALGQTHGNETIRDHAQVHFDDDLRGGLTVTLLDVWVLNPAVWRLLNTACWVPVDHQPLPPPIHEFLSGADAVPIAMSRFGETMLADVGLDPLYAPHAIDDAYYPRDRAEARDRLNISDDAYLVGMVAANKGNAPARKCWAECFEAFRDFQRRHTDAVLYLQTELAGRFDGVDLPALVEALGIPPASVVFCDQYRAVHYPFTADRMALNYSALDVLLMPSAGEGFGIPAVEAQACGVPVIGSDFSAQPELIGAGWLVSGQRQLTALKSWQFVPSIADIVDALDAAYGRSAKQVEAEAQTAQDKADEYRVDHVYDEYLHPALQAAADRFEDRKPVELAAT